MKSDYPVLVVPDWGVLTESEWGVLGKSDCPVLITPEYSADFQIPAGDIELRAEERRPLAISWLDDFEKILSNP